MTEQAKHCCTIMDPKTEISSINKFVSLSKNLPVKSKQVSIVGIGAVKCPVLKTENGSSAIKGISSCAKYLARENGDVTFLLGKDLLESSLINQWLEYRVTKLDRCDDKEMIILLSELNSHLSDKTYFVGYRLTMADVMMFYRLHSVLKSMSFYGKQNYVNLCRWFDNVQNNAALRQKLEMIIFPKVLLN